MIKATNMQQHGFGGRIEEAFSASKAKGKAAFVSFVTAGYPTKDGKSFQENQSALLYLYLLRAAFIQCYPDTLRLGFKVSNACFYHIQRPLVTTIAVFNLSS